MFLFVPLSPSITRLWGLAFSSEKDIRYGRRLLYYFYTSLSLSAFFFFFFKSTGGRR